MSASQRTCGYAGSRASAGMCALRNPAVPRRLCFALALRHHLLSRISGKENIIPSVDITFAKPKTEPVKYDLSEITEVIRNRRTIYPEQFSTRKVQKDMVQHILTNALWAPTHGKTEPWRYVVYSGEGRNKLAEITEKLYREKTPEDQFSPAKLKKILGKIERSSVVIAMVCRRTPETRIPEIEEIEAAVCAAQNAMLTATAYGLGSFWSSPKFIYAEGAAEAFGFTSADKVLGYLYLGYPADEWPKSHRKPLEYITTWVED